MLSRYYVYKDFVIIDHVEDVSDDRDALKILKEQELNEIVKSKMKQLSTKQKRRLMLYLEQGMNYSNVSRIEGVSISTVRTTIKAALEHLRKELKEYL